MDSFGSLTQCIVECDPQAIRSERKVRRVGFILSVAVQLTLLAALIAVPILSPAALPKLLSIVPVPVYRPPVVVQAAAPSRPQPLTQPSYIPRVTSRPTFLVTRTTPDLRNAEIGAPDVLSAAPEQPGIFALSNQATLPAPPREEPQRRLQVGSGVMEGMLIRRIEPTYPVVARTAGISGRVVLSATIARDGSIQSLHVVSGNRLLADAAIVAVRQWRYKPTLLNGQPVEVQTQITVNFVLQ